MGILDAPAPATTAETFALLTSRLAMGAMDCNLQVVGDSTGNEINEWVYLTAQWLATQYPAITVKHRLYNDTPKTYDAATTLQTGTGPRTLTIWNASVSGQDVAYTWTNFATQFSATPDLVIVNYSHNSTGNSNYRPVLYPLCRRIQDSYPGAGIVLTAQNPRAASDSDYTNGLTRCQQVMDLAASEGYGLVNVTQAFLDTPNYATALLNVDGLHPNNAGMVKWAGIVKQHLRKSSTVVPRMSPPRPSRLFVPAVKFTACEGAPTMVSSGTATSPFGAWALDKATQQGIVTQVDFPHTWQAVNLYVVSTVAGSSGFTGSTVARIETGFAQAYNTAVFVGPTTNATTNMGSPQNMASWTVNVAPSNTGTAYQTMITRFVGPEFVTYKSRPIAVRVRRLAADAADLLDESLLVRGIVLERAA